MNQRFAMGVVLPKTGSASFQQNVIIWLRDATNCHGFAEHLKFIHMTVEGGWLLELQMRDVSLLFCGQL